MPLFNEYQFLLMLRESRIVVGSRAVNLWLLVLVLVATFLAIAFSAGSMAYLNEKMNDPFTFWLNVYRESSDVNLREVANGLDNDKLKERFFYDDVQTEIATSLDLFGNDGGKWELFRIQHYENMGSDLIAKVLDNDNAITFGGKTISIAPDSISPSSLGVIMTVDALKKLGYSQDNYPAFVSCRVPAFQADTLGFKIYDGYVAAPLPLLGVVKRLPMNKDILASKYLYIQHIDDYEPEPFNLSKEHHARRLYFFVPNEVTDFDNEALLCIPDSLRTRAMVMESEESIAKRLRSWKAGCIKTVYPYNNPSISIINTIEQQILNKFKHRGVMRVYNYSESPKEINQEQNRDNGLSIHFTRLDSIRSFETYMKDTWNLQIEMTQVNSKENFNAVSVMAAILSAAMIVFSIVCIIIFLTNMLQSYFQKVRRNLGTFKAFGMSTYELMKVYVAIIIGVVVIALALSLSLVWIVELLMLFFGVTKEGGGPYLILWNKQTLWAITILLVCAISSVFVVMQHMLRQTPGDLVYDR